MHAITSGTQLCYHLTRTMTIGALACARSSAFASGVVSLCVSRSSARWPARGVRNGPTRLPALSVSRSSARWPARGETHHGRSQRGRCQSIIGALACARSPQAQILARFLRCQSIIGALACARRTHSACWLSEQSVSRSSARWPAREGTAGLDSFFPWCVSRSSARWPARGIRQGHPKSQLHSVSRSSARWPARGSTLIDRFEGLG